MVITSPKLTGRKAKLTPRKWRRSDVGGVRSPFEEWSEQHWMVRRMDGGAGWVRVEWLPWQRYVIREGIEKRGKDGRLAYRTVLICVPKKHAKSEMAAVSAFHGLLVREEMEPRIVLLANTKEQTRRERERMERAYGLSPWFKKNLKHYRSPWRFETIGELREKYGPGLIEVIAVDDVNAHGGDNSMIIWSEFWGIGTYGPIEALTQSLARREPQTLIFTYKGLNPEEGQPWYDYCIRGREGTDPSMFYFESVGDPKVGKDWVGCAMDACCVPWITMHKLYEEYRILPINRFRRLYCNHATTAEESVVAEDEFSRCVVNEDLELADVRGEVVWGIDIGLKRDRSAIYGLTWEKYKEKFRRRVVYGASWTPTTDKEIDLDDTVLPTIRYCAETWEDSVFYYDPWQFEAKAKDLENEGIDVRPYPQSEPNLVRMANAVHDAFRGRELLIPFEYSEDLWEDFKRLIAVEAGHGTRKLGKRQSRHKIDRAIALAIALVNMGTVEEDALGERMYVL